MHFLEFSSHKLNFSSASDDIKPLLMHVDFRFQSSHKLFDQSSRVLTIGLKHGRVLRIKDSCRYTIDLFKLEQFFLHKTVVAFSMLLILINCSFKT